MLRVVYVTAVTLMTMISAVAARAAAPFAGSWDTDYGRMYLTERNGQVSGFYIGETKFSTVEGQVKESRLTFKYREPNATGDGYFDIAEDGLSLRGGWHVTGATEWQPWNARRSSAPQHDAFAGLWNTSYGRMRMMEISDGLRGSYAMQAGSKVSGTVANRRLTFTYEEPNAAGEGYFDLAPDGRSFRGKWRAKGGGEWQDWFGERIDPVAGRVWLVIIEAHWENNLSEPEYSFGAMLRAFFARSPQVQVRHRFIGDSNDLVRACQEVAYLAEPVVLSISSHGSPQGITVDGQTIGARSFIDGLEFASNIRLLHFSSCAVMHDRMPQQILSASHAKFPVSGYRESVDWAASAVVEFMYFDLILCRDLAPAKAVEQIRLLTPIAGDQPINGSVIAPCGFRLMQPKE